MKSNGHKTTTTLLI